MMFVRRSRAAHQFYARKWLAKDHREPSEYRHFLFFLGIIASFERLEMDFFKIFLFRDLTEQQTEDTLKS